MSRLEKYDADHVVKLLTQTNDDRIGKDENWYELYQGQAEDIKAQIDALKLKVKELEEQL